MAIRHVFLATVFISLFGFGMVNVMTDGRLVHELKSELPNHAGEGNVSIGEVEPITLEPGDNHIETVEIQNARRISYGDPTLNSNNSVSFDMSLQPPPSGVEDSMPPNYVYDHQERTAEASLNFSAGQSAGAENLTFKLKAKPGDINSSETVREISVQVQ